MKNSRKGRKGTKGTKRRKTLKTPPGAKGGVGKGMEKVGEASRAVSASRSPIVRCPHCHHSLKNNPHGFDQNDAWVEGDRLVHSGRCTYCKECNPRIREALEKIEEQKQLGSGWPCHTFLETPIYRKLPVIGTQPSSLQHFNVRVSKEGITLKNRFTGEEFPAVTWYYIAEMSKAKRKEK